MAYYYDPSGGPVPFILSRPGVVVGYAQLGTAAVSILDVTASDAAAFGLVAAPDGWADSPLTYFVNRALVAQGSTAQTVVKPGVFAGVPLESLAPLPGAATSAPSPRASGAFVLLALGAVALLLWRRS